MGKVLAEQSFDSSLSCFYRVERTLCVKGCQPSPSGLLASRKRPLIRPRITNTRHLPAAVATVGGALVLCAGAVSSFQFQFDRIVGALDTEP